MQSVKRVLLIVVLSVATFYSAAAQDSAPQFAHSPCNGVDLTGQTITFYHAIDLNDQPEILGNPVQAGYADASAYFNAHGGICGATIENTYISDNPQGVAQLDPPPLMIGLYASGTAADFRNTLAAAEIPALLVRGGSIPALYGNDRHTLGWVFGTSPLYLNQVSSICDYIAAHPDQYPDPSLGFISVDDDWARGAITNESIAYCEAHGVPVADAAYFAGGTTYVEPQVQRLLDAGANIFYTNSTDADPSVVASTLVSMGVRDQVTLAAVHIAMDSAVASYGTDKPGADGLPPLNGTIGSLPARSFSETDNAGIQFITAQADANNRPANLRNRAYISAWTATDLFIETVIQTGNRVGWMGMNGADIKDTLENIVYAPLGGIQQIDYQGGTRRDLADNRIGEIAYLGADGINPASADNPLAQPITPLLLPLTDFLPVTDLRPVGVDVEQASGAETAQTALAAAGVGALPFGSLVFDMNSEIYALSANSSDPVQLTDNNFFDGQALWSPDETKIVFVSDRDGNQEVYVMDADGSNIVDVSNNPAFDEIPAWSPDGTRISFNSDLGGQTDVWIANADGTNPVNLTDNPAFDGFGTLSPDGTRLAFTSDRDGNNEIYVMNIDGSSLTRLTDDVSDDIFPVWSPDGTKILFNSERDGDMDTYMMNADGSDPVNLSNDPASEEKAAWSPDGEWIVFLSNRDGNWAQYVLNIASGALIRLPDNVATNGWASWTAAGGAAADTNAPPAETVGALPFGTLVFEMGGRVVEDTAEIATLTASGEINQLTDNTFFDGEPIWSPDGSQIVFASNRDGNLEVYVMNADGSSVVNITNSPAYEDTPWWSPDGTRISYNSDRTGDVEIWIANADGSDPINLTDNPGDDFMASWSPDGTQIAFVSTRDDNAEIYVINTDGTGVTRLTDDPGEDIFPVWSPNGTKILFISTRDGDADTYMMNADGGDVVNLSMDDANGEKATWSPDGAWVLLTSNRSGVWAQYALNIASGAVIRLADIAEREVWPSWKP